MLFVMVGQLGPRMRQVDGGWRSPLGNGQFWGECEHPIVTNGDFVT